MCFQVSLLPGIDADSAAAFRGTALMLRRTVFVHETENVAGILDRHSGWAFPGHLHRAWGVESDSDKERQREREWEREKESDSDRCSTFRSCVDRKGVGNGFRRSFIVVRTELKRIALQGHHSQLTKSIKLLCIRYSLLIKIRIITTFRIYWHLFICWVPLQQSDFLYCKCAHWKVPFFIGNLLFSLKKVDPLMCFTLSNLNELS